MILWIPFNHIITTNYKNIIMLIYQAFMQNDMIKIKMNYKTFQKDA